jgi:hypothetical protein
MKNKKYLCANCNVVFESEWSDEEANAETKEYFGVDNASQRDDMVVVCDDCFQMMHPLKYPDLVEKSKQELNEKQNGTSTDTNRA